MLHDIASVRAEYYSLLNTIALIVLLIYQYFHFKQKRDIPSFCVEGVQRFFKKRPQNILFRFLSKDYLWIFLEITIMAYFIQYYGIFNHPFGELWGTGANYYGLLFINGSLYIIYCCIVGINPLKQMDWATISYPLALVFSKFACFCGGCCRGFNWEYGMYNYASDYKEFPTQLLEAGLALVIFIYLLKYKKTAKTGTMFPMYLILFSATRFFSEFTRKDNELWGPFTNYHPLCVIGVALGFLVLYIVGKYGDRINAYFEKKYRGLIGFIVRKIKKVEADGTPARLTDKY